MSDYISREELSDNLCYGISCNECSFNTASDGQSGCLLQERIDNLPSADVRENIKGEWIKIQSGDKDFPEIIVCNKCYHENSHLDFNEHNEPIGKVFVKSKFCPNCGADMRGEAYE